jgi:hypothetical protein
MATMKSPTLPLMPVPFRLIMPISLRRQGFAEAVMTVATCRNASSEVFDVDTARPPLEPLLRMRTWIRTCQGSDFAVMVEATMGGCAASAYYICVIDGGLTIRHTV